MNDATNGVMTQQPDEAAGADLPATAGLMESTTERRRGADPYDTILWRLRPQESGVGYAIGLTSCDRHAGVSTVAANVAIRAADHQLGPVLLLDANAGRPRQDRHFRLYDKPGLADVLAGRCELHEAVHETGVAGLSLMPLGSKGLIDRARIDHGRVHAMLIELRSEFATMVVDLPPVEELRHALLIAQRLDAAVMVLRSEATRIGAADRAAKRLASDGVPLIGSVVTRQKSYLPNWLRRRG